LALFSAHGTVSCFFIIEFQLLQPEDKKEWSQFSKEPEMKEPEIKGKKKETKQNDQPKIFFSFLG